MLQSYNNKNNDFCSTVCGFQRVLLFSSFFCVALIALQTGAARAISTPIIPDQALDVPGIRIGAFTANFSTATAVTHDSNIYQSSDANSDTIFLVSPRLSFTSNFVRHSLSIELDLDSITYDQAGENDVVNYGASINSTIHIRRGLELGLEASARLDHDDLGDDDRDIADRIVEPIEYEEYKVKATITRQIRRYTASLAVGYTKTDYANALVDTTPGAGVSLVSRNIDFRDLEQLEFSGEFSYKLTPHFTVVSTAQVNISEYAVADTDGVRDSTNYQIGNTIEYRPTSKANFRFGITHSKEDFEAPGRVDTDWLPTYSFAFNWIPSAFWDVTFDFRFAESGVDFADDVSSSESSAYGITVRYRPRRNLTLTSRFNYTLDEFSSSSLTGVQESETYTYTMAADYKIYEGVNFSLNYGYEKVDSTRGDDSYEQHVVQGAVKVGF